MKEKIKNKLKYEEKMKKMELKKWEKRRKMGNKSRQRKEIKEKKK